MSNSLRQLQDEAIMAAQVPPVVANVLDKWAIWMQGGNMTRGYPSKSSGISSGDIHSSEDIHEQNDSYAARACDGAIMSLNPVQVAAIAED